MDGANYATWENPDVKFVVPSEGSDLWVDTMVIMKASANKDEAHAFINYILDQQFQPGLLRI
jgi:spermidine/putrescine transport system substrate-binding protein